MGHDIEIVEQLKAHERNWVTLPEEDLQRNDEECLLDHCPSLEVELNHAMLKENVKIMVPPDCQPEQLPEVLGKHMENTLPVIIYTISNDLLSEIVSNFYFVLVKSFYCFNLFTGYSRD